MKTAYIIIYTYLLAFFIMACATQSSPTGGERDEEPPKLISSIPINQELNYTGKKIELVFDELIAINNVNKELIITPRIEQDYEVKYKKNHVLISFENPLDSNTTYTFTFRESIKDLNEGNVPENLNLAFSTGDYLDSLSITGMVYDLFTNQKRKDISVALYSIKDTMNVFDDPPLYITKTDTEGNYYLNNVKNGRYRIYAFDDKNNNLSLQTDNEKYGFREEIIKLDSNKYNIDMSLFYLNIDTMKLQSARTSGHYFHIKYNKYITEYTIQSLDTNIIIHNSLLDDHKEIRIYNTSIIKDSIPVVTIVKDSLLETSRDTVYIKFEETKREKEKYSLKITSENINYLKPEIKGKIEFNKPSTFYNPDSLFLFVDSLSSVNITNENLKWNKNFTEVTIYKEVNKEIFEPKLTGDTTKKGKEVFTQIKPKIYIGKGAFQSIERDTSIYKSTSIKKEISDENTGIIKIKINNKDINYILQLLNKNNEILKTINKSNNTDITFNKLIAGEYKIRILIDSNNNGKWEVGNIKKNMPPERIIYYISEEGNETITVRANWEIGPLNINF